jgi:hypothetical protein
MLNLDDAEFFVGTLHHTAEDQRICLQDTFASTTWSVSTWPILFDTVGPDELFNCQKQQSLAHLAVERCQGPPPAIRPRGTNARVVDPGSAPAAAAAAILARPESYSSA